MSALLHFFRQMSEATEVCFNVQVAKPLTDVELQTLTSLLWNGAVPSQCGNRSKLAPNGPIVEIGPRMNFATASSTNAVAICHACGLTKVTRIEQSRRHALNRSTDVDSFIAANHDRMTEQVYMGTLRSFTTGVKPQPVRIIPVLEEGEDALRRINADLGLGMDDWDITFYTDFFQNVLKRDPTDVECFQLGQANSEHSRHWFFRGRMVRNGVVLPRTLMEIIRAPYERNPGNSVIAFSDNASAISGFTITTLIPERPGEPSPFTRQERTYHLTFTAETHNHPSGVAPYPGAATGTGGRIRDGHAVGRGGLVIAGTAGYCAGNLCIPDFPISGEDAELPRAANLADPLSCLIEMSNGASDYGNRFGEPVIAGFTRTFDLVLTDSDSNQMVRVGERRGWLKPIMFSGGIGQIDGRHIEKVKPSTGMVVIQIGGPAYRIGMGGGAASSMISGESTEELDFASVQRGDPQMENRVNRVIRTCIELGDDNPILAIHDQGAGGPCNVLTELVEPAGGRVAIRQINLGDDTLSVLEIWGAEYQERDALLISKERLSEFQEICGRENVPCEVLGTITGDGRIVLTDSRDSSSPVDLPLDHILGDMPQKTFTIDRVERKRAPLELPKGITVAQALEMVFRLPSVGSKGFLVHKVDRSVTGLVAQQQCCGPMQIPVGDVGVMAQSHLGFTGGATAIGEQPIKMLVDPVAGSRMAVGEALTNLAAAKISRLEDVRYSANWMWAAKLAGEGSDLYDAAEAAAELMAQLRTAADGGKDSLSMAALVDTETVKAPGQLVISAYAPVPDIRKVVTPDLKRQDGSTLLFLDLARGNCRLGGSALAQAHGQIGNDVPDVVEPSLLASGFDLAQELIANGLILSYHDRSDGGLITTLAEMAMAGNCGIEVDVSAVHQEVLSALFAEELGVVVEVDSDHVAAVDRLARRHGVHSMLLGHTNRKRECVIRHLGKTVFAETTQTIRRWWEATSDRLEDEQRNPSVVSQLRNSYEQPSPSYRLTYAPEPTSLIVNETVPPPIVAIIREEGSNGDREMAAAFEAAGFTAVDVSMRDLRNGKFTIDNCQGAAFVGGFSYADVLGAAVGWAGVIRSDPNLAEIFERFRKRPDSFSLGVCNGCQLMAQLGWVLWDGIEEGCRPQFTTNASGRFESRWVTVRVEKSPAIMLRNMEGSRLGVWVAHGEGRVAFPSTSVATDVRKKNLSPLVFVDHRGQRTSSGAYPYNPNGSLDGMTALCSEDGRHLAMMPHPERCFLPWQWPWMPETWKTMGVSPWLRMFQNAYQWCIEQNTANV